MNGPLPAPLSPPYYAGACADRCPACGKGSPVYPVYLRQAPTCSHASEPTGQIRARMARPGYRADPRFRFSRRLTFIVSMKVALRSWLSLSALGAFAIGAVLFPANRIKGASLASSADAANSLVQSTSGFKFGLIL